jgi:ubiquinone/menaquinone biosynthesis C-methylase UbiE
MKLSMQEKTNKIITNSFDNPQGYRINSKLQYIFAHNVIKEINFKARDRILDMGCGDGKIAAEIAKTIPEGKIVCTTHFDPDRNLNHF